MGLEWGALELGVELDADEPGVVGPLDDFRQLAVRGHAGENEARAFQRAAVMDVDFIAVTVPLADQVRSVDGAHDAVAIELGRIGAEPHRPAEIAAGGALLQPLLAHPFGDHADDRFRSLAELGGRGFADPGLIPRRLDAGHLHAQANADKGNVALAGEFDGCDLALAAALAEPTGAENAV